MIYDELIHHQVHPYLVEHANSWNALADIIDCTNPEVACAAIEAGLHTAWGSS